MCPQRSSRRFLCRQDDTSSVGETRNLARKCGHMQPRLAASGLTTTSSDSVGPTTLANSCCWGGGHCRVARHTCHGDSKGNSLEATLGRHVAGSAWSRAVIWLARRAGGTISHRTTRAFVVNIAGAFVSAAWSRHVLAVSVRSAGLHANAGIGVCTGKSIRSASIIDLMFVLHSLSPQRTLTWDRGKAKGTK